MVGVVFSSLKGLIQRHPTAFNSITGCALCSISDFGAQQIEDRPRGGDGERTLFLDFRRLFAAGLVGMFFGGWVYPNAYAILDLRFPAKNFQTILTKSVVEIATVGIFVNTVSMTSRGLLAGRDCKNVARHVVQEMRTVTMNDARVWLPYNLLAFSVIPAVMRPTTTIMMEASWQTYISLRSNDYENRVADATKKRHLSSSSGNPTKI